MRKSAALFFSCLLLTSCEKKNTTSLKVTLWNVATDSPMKGKEIELAELKAGTRLNREDKKTLVKKLETDANGVADFGTFDAKSSTKNTYQYYIETGIENAKYLEPAKYEVKAGAENEIVYNLLPFAGRFAIELNGLIKDQEDYMNVTFVHSTGYNVNLPVIKFNRSISRYEIFSMVMGRYYLTIAKQKGGIHSEETDTLNIGWNEEKTYSVHYN
jgi:hypothetical protein